MKTFVLVAVLLLPTALSAQVLIPSRVPEKEPATLLAPFESSEASPMLAAERVSDRPPAITYKLQVIRPSREVNARLRVARPDSRYDYKLLMPREATTTRPRAGTPRKR